MRPNSIPRRHLFAAVPWVVAATIVSPRHARAQGGFLEKGIETLKGLSKGGSALSDAKIGRGLREALEVASETVIDRVGQPGGYLRDEAIHIPLPGFLGDAQQALSAAGVAGLLNDLETRLNRAAEEAAPHARELFLDAIGEMTLEDARGILNGPDDAATDYFRRTMTPNLKATFRPIVDRELQRVGAVATLDTVSQRLENIPFASGLTGDPKARLVDHGLEGALDGIFHYLAKEEAAIRNNPAKRTTDLLRDVFG